MRVNICVWENVMGIVRENRNIFGEKPEEFCSMEKVRGNPKCRSGFLIIIVRSKAYNCHN
jgi:hypothetical protein